MFKNKSTMKALGAAVVAVLVTACGSGGTSKSSSSDNTSEPNPTVVDRNLPVVELNSANFASVASQSLKSLLLNDAGSNALNRTVVITADQNTAILNTVSGVIFKLPSYPCSHGGDMRLELVVNNSDGKILLDLNNPLDMSFDATFNSCNQGGNHLDGDVGLVLSANLGQIMNNPVYSVDSHLEVNGLTVAQPNLPSFVFDGSFDYKVGSTDGVTVNMDIVSNNVIYFADQSYQMLDFSLNKSVNNTTQAYSYYINSEFTDSTLPNARVSYQTLEPLTGTGFSLPTGGLLAVQGVNGSVLIHAQQDQSLLLQLDIGDDGAIDEEHYTTWQDLVLNSFTVQQ